jgi:hypothetical protein
MRISRWFVGLAATGAIASALASGCGSSSKSSPSVDSGPDRASSDIDAFVCMPEPLGNIPDSGIFAPGCGPCVTSMCMAQVAACSADCTCGSQLNMVNTCLAGLPPQEGGAAGGLAGLLAGGGTGALTCLSSLASGGGGIAGLLGGGGGGLAGLLGGGGAATEGGAATDDAAPAGGALGGVLTCLLTTCSCFGSLTMEGGAPEAGGGAGDSSSPEAASADAPSEAASADGSSDAAAQ